MEKNLFLKPNAVDRVILIDGISRAGKMLTGILVSNLKALDYFQFWSAVDHIPILWRVGAISLHDAAAYLRINIDVHSYDRALGRNLNTRASDASSILRAPHRDDYDQRAANNDSEAAWKFYEQSGRQQCFLVHEMLPNVDVFFEAVPDLALVHMERHPIDLCFSWSRSGWGERWGADPMAFIPVLDIDGKPVPWYAAEWAEDYLSLPIADRIIRGIITLQEACAGTYEQLEAKQKDRIAFFNYESLVSKPAETMSAIAGFLNTKPRADISAAFERERLPNELPIEKRKEKFEEIKKKAAPEFIELLADASRRYEERWDLPPAV